MKFKESFVHPFKTITGHYLYDVNTNRIVSIPKNLYAYFNNESQIIDEESVNFANRLYKNGFLKANPIERIEHMAGRCLASSLDRCVQGITLQVTQQCNLRCKYCTYSGNYSTRDHSSMNMPVDIAKKSIDFLLSHSSDVEVPFIGFYGGEPFLNFDLLKIIADYTLNVFEGKKVLFGLTTNATLLNDESMKFLEDYEINILISLDGPKEIHDANRVFAGSRKGTFDVIMAKIKYIKDNYPNLYRRIIFNSVIDPTLDPSCLNEFFIHCKDLNSEKINSSIMSMEFLKDNKKTLAKSKEYFIVYRTEEFQVFMSKLGRIHPRHFINSNWQPFESLKNILSTLRNVSKELPKVYHPSGPCLTGARKLFVDIAGNFYPCERVSETSESMRIGHINRGFDLKKVYSLLNIGKLTEAHCKKCWAIRLCGQCCVTADDGKKIVAEKRLSNCNLTLSNADRMLKSFCTLKEQGFSFENDHFSI